MKTLIKLKWHSEFREADVEVVCRVNKTDLLYLECIYNRSDYERNYISFFEFKNEKDKEKLVREFEIKEIIE